MVGLPSFCWDWSFCLSCKRPTPLVSPEETVCAECERPELHSCKRYEEKVEKKMDYISIVHTPYNEAELVDRQLSYIRQQNDSSASQA